MNNFCTDEHGNLANCNIGDIVEDNLAIFTVGEIHCNSSIPWFVSMDKTKPYKIKDESNPMATCVKQGNYAVRANCLKRYDGEVENE